MQVKGILDVDRRTNEGTLLVNLDGSFIGEFDAYKVGKSHAKTLIVENTFGGVTSQDIHLPEANTLPLGWTIDIVRVLGTGTGNVVVYIPREPTGFQYLLELPINNIAYRVTLIENSNRQGIWNVALLGQFGDDIKFRESFGGSNMLGHSANIFTAIDHIRVHNNLADMQGGEVNEYYHLNAVEHGIYSDVTTTQEAIDKLAGSATAIQGTVLTVDENQNAVWKESSPADQTTITLTATEVITRLDVITPTGQPRTTNPNGDVIGIALTSANIGETFNVLTAGLLTLDVEETVSFVPSDPVYAVGNNIGNEFPILVGKVIPLGYPLSDKSMVINITRGFFLVPFSLVEWTISGNDSILTVVHFLRDSYPDVKVFEGDLFTSSRVYVDYNSVDKDTIQLVVPTGSEFAGIVRIQA